MKAYVIFDVQIDDPVRYQEYRDLLWRGVEAAGGKYLVRDGALKVYEGEWMPRDLVLLEFPSVAAWEAFYHRPSYQGLKGHCHVGDFYLSTGRPAHRPQTGNQWLGVFHSGGDLQNPLFLTNVTMPYGSTSGSPSTCATSKICWRNAEWRCPTRQFGVG